MRARCLVTIAVLVVWIIVGPVATAFCACCGMGTICKHPCAVTSNSAPTPSDPAPPLLVGHAPIPPSHRSPQTTLQVPAPPPRLLALAA